MASLLFWHFGATKYDVRIYGVGSAGKPMKSFIYFFERARALWRPANLQTTLPAQEDRSSMAELARLLGESPPPSLPGEEQDKDRAGL